MSTLKVNKIEHTSTTDGGVSIDSSGNVTLPANTKVGTQNLPSAGPLSNRNLIINGAMNIWQRGTSSTGLGGGSAYLADRWMFEALGGTAARVTYDRVEDSPTISDDVNYSPYSARITITTTGGTASGDFGLLRQMIEGYNFQHIYQRPFTVSFWVKSSITGTFAFSAYGGAVTTGTPSFTQTYTIDTADTWEYKTISVPACPAGTLSNWSFTSGRGLDVMWRLWDNASSHSGTLGEWNTNTYSVPDASYTNLAGTNGATWQITQVQIEPGSVATPFEHRSFGDELARCQRYYCKTYNQDVFPGASDKQGSLFVYKNSSNNAGWNFNFPVQMRAVPSFSTYSHAGTVDKCSFSTTDISTSTNGPINGSARIMIYANGAVADDCYVHVAASAEL